MMLNKNTDVDTLFYKTANQKRVLPHKAISHCELIPLRKANPTPKLNHWLKKEMVQASTLQTHLVNGMEHE